MTTNPQTDAEPELTEAQQAYNVAQSEMFQLAAYGHHRYHPTGECLTDEGRRQHRDYLDRLRAAREELEAALLRLVAEHAGTFRGSPTVDWLRSLADDGALLSLLAVRPDERDFDTEPAVSVPAPAPTDRAAILAEVESVIQSEIHACGYSLDAGCDFCNGVTTALEKVRRLAAAASGSGRVADETQARSDIGTEFVQQADHPDTAALDAVEAELAAEAHPAEHVWAAELYDPHAEEWVPGTRYRDRDRAVNALDHGRRVGPAWKDGTPTQRRLVRATTTYAVEAEQPAAGSRSDGEA